MATAVRAEVDVAIFGGGVAGLWTLAHLRRRGFATVLFEAGRLGGGQSMAAQGIIHGGLKYAAAFRLGAASAALGDMPAQWRRCLRGETTPDLRAVRVLADHHLMWLPPGLLGAATGFFASHAVQSRATRLGKADWPAVLQEQPTVGAVYQLDEPVLDVPSLLRALADPVQDALHRIDWPAGVQFSEKAGHVDLRLGGADGSPILLQAKACLFAAGAGNEALLARLPQPPGQAQRRPLHMLMVEGPRLPLFAHCFATSDKPRITITSYPHAAGGGYVWYLGGQLAEDGVGRDPAAQIAAGRAELAALLPELSQADWRWSSLRVDRAEAHHLGRRPDHPVLQSAGPFLVAWPTKLAFAPRLATMVEQALAVAGVTPGARAADRAALAALPMPELAAPPWEEAAQWS